MFRLQSLLYIAQNTRKILGEKGPSCSGHSVRLAVSVLNQHSAKEAESILIIVWSDHFLAMLLC